MSAREPLPPSAIERNAVNIQRAVVAVCVLLVLGDVAFALLGHRHTHFAFEGYIGVYGAVGFLSYVGLVLSAKVLRKLVMRPEDFYERPVTARGGTTPAAHVTSPAPTVTPPAHEDSTPASAATSQGAQDAAPGAHDTEPSAQHTVPEEQDREAETQDAEPSVQDAAPGAQDPEPEAQGPDTGAQDAAPDEPARRSEEDPS